MEQSNISITTEKKHFQHLHRSDRDTIEALFRSGMTSRTQIARIVGVHPSTISRELKLGTVINLKSSLEQYQTYSAEVAQQRKNVACSAKGPQPKITTSMADLIVSLMSLEKRSPFDALATLGDLPYRKMSRKPKQYPQKRKAYTARKNTSIEKRPAEVEDRLVAGS